jgi:hypothetical protein
MVARCQNLRNLTLQALPISGKQFDDLFLHYPELDSLGVWNCPHIEPGHINLVSFKLPKLKSLSLSSLNGYTDVYFNSFLKSFRNLTRLEMRGMPLTDASFSNPEVDISKEGDKPKLRTVIIHGASLEGKIPFTALNTITDLELSFCPNLTPHIFPTLAALPALTSLAVKGCSFFGEFGTPTGSPKVLSRSNSSSSIVKKDNSQPNSPKGSFLFLPRKITGGESKEVATSYRFKQLKHLDLSGCSGFNDDDVCGIVQNAPSLRSLDVSRCTYLTEKCFNNVLKYCSLPDGVIMDQCKIPAFTSELLKPNHKLEETLHFSNENGATMLTLEITISRYLTLQRRDPTIGEEVHTLSFSHCEILTNDNLKRLASVFSKVQTMKLIKAPMKFINLPAKLTNDPTQNSKHPLAAIFESFPNLESLHIEDVYLDFNELDFGRFPKMLSLKRLICKNNDSFGDSSTVHFSDKFPKLQHLSLLKVKVTDKGLVDIVKTNPLLVKLKVDEPAPLLEKIIHARLETQAKLLDYLRKECEKK